MKKILFGIVLFLFVLSPFFTVEATAVYKAEQNFAQATSTKTKGNVYTVGKNLIYSGRILGDLFSAGQYVNLNGWVSKDAFLLGSTISVSGTVSEDLRVAGSDIILTNTLIGGDLMAFGNGISIMPSAQIAGDTLLIGQKVSIQGLISGRTDVYADKVEIDGDIVGNISISANQIVLGERAAIRGNITYTSLNKIIKQDGARIFGQEKFIKASPAYGKPLKTGGKDFMFMMGSFMSLMFVVKLLLWTLLALLVVKLFRKFSKQLMQETEEKWGQNLLIGFLTVVFVLPVFLLLAVTVIGLPFAFILLLGLALVAIITKLFMGIFVGHIMGGWADGRKTLWYRLSGGYELSWKNVLWGTIVTSFLMIVPIVGWLILALIFLSLFGAIIRLTYKEFWLKR